MGTDIVLLGLCALILIMGFGLIMLAFRLAALWSRYEQFRGETALMFRDTHETMADINMRLSQAGYPPGRLAPRTAFSSPGYPPSAPPAREAEILGRRE